jgi:protein-L-isoaspartate O-methyltransferase
LPIDIDPNELQGKALLNQGVYDLAVFEEIWRLCDKGETALDIGANIGIMTALLAHRVGSSGKVLCFEADPAIRTELQANTFRWNAILGASVIDIIPLEAVMHFGACLFLV